MSNIAYVRVSTAEQNEARQIEALKKHNIDKWFTEKVSGKNMNRPQLEAMLDYVREGDTVYMNRENSGFSLIYMRSVRLESTLCKIQKNHF